MKEARGDRGGHKECYGCDDGPGGRKCCRKHEYERLTMGNKIY